MITEVEEQSKLWKTLAGTSAQKTLIRLQVESLKLEQLQKAQLKEHQAMITTSDSVSSKQESALSNAKRENQSLQNDYNQLLSKYANQSEDLRRMETQLMNSSNLLQELTQAQEVQENIIVDLRRQLSNITVSQVRNRVSPGAKVGNGLDVEFAMNHKQKIKHSNSVDKIIFKTNAVLSETANNFHETNEKETLRTKYDDNDNDADDDHGNGNDADDKGDKGDGYNDDKCNGSDGDDNTSSGVNTAEENFFAAVSLPQQIDTKSPNPLFSSSNNNLAENVTHICPVCKDPPYGLMVSCSTCTTSLHSHCAGTFGGTQAFVCRSCLQ